MSEAAQHWLLRVAGLAGRPPAGSVALHPRAPLDEAWRVASAACGIPEEDLAHRVAAAFRTVVADLAAIQLSAVKLIPEKVVRQFQIVPLRDANNVLTIATADPTNVAAEQSAGFASGRRIAWEIATPSQLGPFIGAKYAPARMAETVLSALPAQLSEAVRVIQQAEPENLTVYDVEKAPFVRLTNLILSEGIQSGASDIHIEPELKDGVVRMRVDGVLRTYLHIPRAVLDRVVSRVKVMGEMDVADRLRPHAGRAHIQVGGVDYDLRLSTVPTRHSEKAVIRILEPGRAHSLSDLKVPDAELDRLRQLFANREGILVVTGPTGSGKTTTLYAALQELATGKINIMTVEDPVEYELSGVTQIQVAPRQELTFAAALRTILRQDPDVILVGEIRDLETAEIAIQASMTGHLVLTTLHTIDAVGVLGRLAGLGVNRAHIASSLRGVIAQRLMRRLCSHCSERIAGPLTPEEQALADRYGIVPAARAGGCERCGGTGFRGRIPILEILVNTPAIEKFITDGQSALAIRRHAEQTGMTSMMRWGLTRVEQGESTLDELERVLGIGSSGEGSAAADDSTAPGAAAAEPGPRPGPHVFCVGSDPATREKIQGVLQRGGYRVSGAIDLSTAWQRLGGGGDVSLVVIDFSHGSIGRELLLRLKSRPATAGLPIVALIPENRHLEANLTEEGVDDCIHTPVDAREFLARIRACFRRRWPDSRDGGAELAALLEASAPSVAVLPFVDLSPDQDQAYLCDGLAEELTHALARMEGMRVAARTSSFRFRAAKSDVREIGRQLGVSTLLEGSIQKSGTQLRVSARLVNVDDGCELMSERYERDLTEAFALQDEITRHVTERLRSVLLGVPEPSRAPAPASDADALELYLKGRYAWNRRTEEGLTHSVVYFQQAIDRAPTHAAAHAGLADAYVALAVYGALRPGDAMPRALQAADRALAIDPKSAEALVALSCVRALYLWDRGAEEGFLRALELEPSNPTVHHWYAAHYLMPRGRFADARRHLERAASLDPLSSAIKATLGVIFYFEREFEKAVAQQRHTIAADRDFGISYYFLALAQAELGRFDEAIEALGQARERSGDTAEIASARGYTLARAGEIGRARDALAGLTSLAGERFVSPVLLAQVAAGLGDLDGAFEHLADAFDVRATDLVWLAVRPTFDHLRADARWGEVHSPILDI